MQPAEPRKLGVLKTRDRAEQANLLGVLELGLEADHVPQGAELVVLPQLDHCIRPAAVRVLWRRPVRVVETNRLHWTKAECLRSARSHDLDRHAAFEVRGACFPFAEF